MTDKSANAPDQIPRLATIAGFLLLVCDIAITLYFQLNGSESPRLWITILIPALAAALVLGSLLSNRPARAPSASIGGDCYDNIDQVSLLVDTECIVRRINRAASRMTGKTHNELIGTPVHGWFHPPQYSEQECPLCQRIKANEPMPACDFAFPNQTWQAISLTRLSGSINNLLIQLHNDVTPRKRIEEQLALVIDGAQLGYWDWDYASGKHTVNQRWLEMLGLNEDELDNYVSDWDERIHPEDRPRVHELIAKHIKSGRPYVVEFRMRHKHGHWVWIQGSGAVVAYDPSSGQPSRLCGTHQDISARKQTESNLRAAYQIISQSAAVVLKWNNSEGMPIEFATENARQLFGYEVEQLITGHVFYQNLIHPDDLGLYRREIDSARLDPDCREVLHQPYRVIAKNGAIKWIQDRKVLTRDEQGQIINFLGLVTDVTRQRQQSSAIRNIVSSTFPNNDSSLLDNLTLLTLETLGADYAWIAETPAGGKAQSLSFCAKGKIVSKRVFALPYSPFQALGPGQIGCIEQGAARQFPHAKWLERHQIEGHLMLSLVDKQQTVFGFIAVSYCRPIPDATFASDILKLFAAQISAELERSRAIDALQDQKQRLLDAQAISHIGDWRWNLQDNLFSWSDEMYRISGTDKTIFTPSLPNILTSLVHQDDQTLFKNAMENAASGGAIDFRHRIVLNDGRLRHVHQRGKPIRDTDNRLVGMQGTMQDITDRLKIEERLLEAKQQAEQATRVKSEFLANMSHEIRTPMNAIFGLVELCLNSDMPPKQRDYLQRVETASRSLMTIIDDILDFSKMEAGKLQLEPLPFLLEEMLDHVFSTMSELCVRKGITLIRPPAEQLYHAVVGDPQRLRQIFINLIGNAIKFTEHGKVTISFRELGRSEKEMHLQFSISDTGVGMSPEMQTKLFQAFSQGDGSVTRLYGGTGLGLIISKQLVEQMGGSISVDSREGVGSTFTFDVRLGITSLTAIRHAQYQRKNPISLATLHHLSGARVLLVEDNEVNRIVAIELLEQAQLQVDVAENGEVALNKLRESSYDCVLMDVQMPVLDGYQTTKLLRSIPGCQTLPVIAMTANAMSNDRLRCLQADMDDFVSKPILPETLYSVLVKWIAKTANKSTSDMLPRTVETDDHLAYLYGIDTTSGLQHTAGNAVVYRKILQKFAENHAHTSQEIRQALMHGKNEEARQFVHTLKGLAGSLGALQLRGHLARLEDLVSDKLPDQLDTVGIDKLLTDVTPEMAKVIDGINKMLRTGNGSQTGASTPQLSRLETRQQLSLLIAKLQAFDSDADEQLNYILANIDDQTLVARLLPIKKQIANYEYVDAARALSQLLDHGM